MHDLTNLLGPGYTKSDLVRARSSVFEKGEELWQEERVNELVMQDGLDETEATEQAEYELLLIMQGA